MKQHIYLETGETQQRGHHCQNGTEIDDEFDANRRSFVEMRFKIEFLRDFPFDQISICKQWTQLVHGSSSSIQSFLYSAVP